MNRKSQSKQGERISTYLATKVLGCSLSTVYKLHRTGKLHGEKDGKDLSFDRAEVEALKKSGRVRGRGGSSINKRLDVGSQVDTRSTVCLEVICSGQNYNTLSTLLKAHNMSVTEWCERQIERYVEEMDKMVGKIAA